MPETLVCLLQYENFARKSFCTFLNTLPIAIYFFLEILPKTFKNDEASRSRRGFFQLLTPCPNKATINFVDFIFFISARMYLYCHMYFPISKYLTIISSD